MAEPELEIRNPQLAGRLKRFDDLSNEHLELSRRLLTAKDGALFSVDLVILGALKRSVDLLDGIEVLARRGNFVAAAPLLRLQLDSLIRLRYMASLRDSDTLVRQFLHGTPFSKMKDSRRKPLTDSRLREFARSDYPWLDRVYEETSRMVHLSEKHFLLSVQGTTPPSTAHIVIGKGQPNWPEKELATFLDAVITATDAFLRVVEGWVITKERSGQAAHPPKQVP